VTEWQPFRHPVSPDPRVKFDQCPRQPGQILLTRVRRETDVSGRRYRGSLGDGRLGADDDVAHLVPVQRSYYHCRIQAWLSGPVLAAQAAPSTGTASRHAWS
jgi:hypothetical protein